VLPAPVSPTVTKGPKFWPKNTKGTKSSVVSEKKLGAEFFSKLSFKNKKT
jgi:hypothetical protein